MVIQNNCKDDNGRTPFSLTYSSEAVSLVETSVPTARYQFGAEESNDQLLTHKLDLLDEKRELTSIRTAT